MPMLFCIFLHAYIGEALANAFDAAFGTDSEYGPIDPKDSPKPLDGPWRHGSLKGFAALRGDPKQTKKLYPACGLTSDSQADCLARAVPVAALFSGTRRDPAAAAAAGSQDQPGSSSSMGSRALSDAVAAVTRVTQNTDVAVAFAQAFGALLGEVVARGSAPLQALAAAEKALLALDTRGENGEDGDSEDAADARESARQALATARTLASQEQGSGSGGAGNDQKGPSEPFLRTVLSYAAVPSLSEVTPKPIA